MKPSVFLTVKEAIDYFATDTRTNPTIDIARLMRATEPIRQNYRGGEMNVNLYPIKRDEKGKIVPNGELYAKVAGGRELNELLYAIEDHYRELSGKTIDTESLGLSAQSTTVEESSGFESRPRENTASQIKYGDELVTGTGTQMVGEK